MMAIVSLAAGAFTGVLKESGMLTAMAQAMVSYIPTSQAQHLPFALGLLSAPLNLLLDPDLFTSAYCLLSPKPRK
jgi:CitMHS family citrate-Mg2+:H+ or citrate-Ca2+:H+ symporter